MQVSAAAEVDQGGQTDSAPIYVIMDSLSANKPPKTSSEPAQQL